MSMMVRPELDLFQSTLPVGGATAEYAFNQLPVDISIHAPRGGSDGISIAADGKLRISIHAPRGGSDEYIVHLG